MTENFLKNINSLNPVPCRFCRQTVARSAKYCPHCGHPQTRPRRFWIVFRRSVEVVAFVATAGALLLTYKQLRIQEQTSLELHRTGIAQDSLTREQLRLIGNQIEAIKSAALIQKDANEIALRESQTELTRIINETKPSISLKRVYCSLDSISTSLTVDFENRGKSDASQVEVFITYITSPSSGDSTIVKHTIARIGAGNPISDQTIIPGLVSFKQLMAKIKTKWIWPEFGRIDSSVNNNVLITVQPDSTHGEGKNMSIERAKRVWDQFRAQKK